jgi:hypothetical protein
MEFTTNDLVQMIGRQQIEIEMLRRQNAALRSQIPEPPKSGAPEPEPSNAESVSEAG